MDARSRHALVETLLACAALLALPGASSAEPSPDGGARPAATPGPAPKDARGGEPAAFQAGLDVLLSEPAAAALLQGKRIGLVTNHASVTREGAPAWRAIHEAKLGELVAILTPEHGFLADVEGKGAGRVAGFRGKVHELYGKVTKPTPAMMQGLEVLVFDLQEVGTRFYTYLSTMALCMEAAREAKLPFVVLDRPNPVAPQGAGGGLLEPGFESFVGLVSVPMRHGLTLGEIARYLAGKWPARFGAELHVVQLQGWRRGLWYDDLKRAWIAPSPSLPDIPSVISYPGFCLFEGTNLSVGRGTERPFQLVAAPWLKAGPIVEAVRPLAAELGAELAVEEVTPEDPADGKFPGRACRAIRVTVKDRGRYDPIRLALGLLQEIRRTHPKALRFRKKHFDRLAGTRELRALVEGKKPLDPLLERWKGQREAFAAESKPAELYGR